MYYLFKVEKRTPKDKMETSIDKFKTLSEAYSAFCSEWNSWKKKGRRRIMFITTNRSIISKYFQDLEINGRYYFMVNNILFNYMFWTNRIHDGEVRYVFYTDNKYKAQEAKKFFRILESDDFGYMNTRKTLF
ncbi:MAG: hypothetical protein ACRCX2_19060 [Paraclostridium sp.]